MAPRGTERTETESSAQTETDTQMMMGTDKDCLRKVMMREVLRLMKTVTGNSRDISI